METIIHVGVHKTGSTYLQECVFPKLEGVCYCYKDKITPVINPKVVLMSNEEWSRSLPHRDNQLLTLLALKQSYPNAKIIIEIREFEPWFKSCYSQYIRAGGYMSYKQYYNKYKDCREPVMFYYYCKMMWKDVFLYHHETLKHMPSVVIQGMCDFIGCDMPDNLESKKVNVSLKHIKLWRAINILMRGQWLRKHIESPWWIATFPQRKLLLILEEWKK